MKSPLRSFVSYCLAMVAFVLVISSAGSAAQWPRVKGTGETLSLKAFQKKHQFSNSEMKRRFGAVGRMTCPFGSATVYLIEKSDVFITSDHLFVDPQKKARDRGQTRKCSVQFFFSKKRYQIIRDSLVHGLRTNKSAYNFEWFDWAIGKLTTPVDGVDPMVVGTDTIPVGLDVTVISGGMNDFVPRVCKGKVSSLLGNSSINQFTTTCDTAPGSSGGPIIVGEIDGSAQFPLKAVGLTYGYTLPYWQVSAGDSHLALPLADVEFRKALKPFLEPNSD